jgi:Cys-tRNA(Pro) deacylase
MYWRRGFEERHLQMKDSNIPVTNAVRVLRAARAEFTPHHYDYVERGGTRHAAESLGVEEHAVVKTLVMEVHNATRKRMILVLMHGDREVSTKQLARLLEAKTVSPANEGDVEKNTGYLPGGVSPFGTRISLSVYVEESILALERIYIYGGKRGFLVAMHPGELARILGAVAVRVAIERRS